MSAVDVEVPQTKWSMLVWKTIKEKPYNDEKVLMDIGGEVVVGRFIDGSFVSRSWGHSENDVRLWASWPKAPKW